MDWLSVNTILPQALGQKACVPSDMGGGLMLSPILTQAPAWVKKVL
jgi:hypothetical protein